MPMTAYTHAPIVTTDTSVIYASVTGCLQVNSPVACQRLSAGKTTRMAVAMMKSNDMVVGEYHLVGPSCQRYD